MQWSFNVNNFCVCLSLQSWRWCLRCCSVVVASKGTHKVEQNCTHKKNPTKYPKFKCNTVSVSFSACRCSSVVFSSKVGREKKRVWGQFCEWVSSAVACMPAAVSLLLLEVLFMQISGVSLALTWPLRVCLLRVLCASSCYELSPFQAHWGRWHCTRFLSPVCLFTAHMGSGSSPLSCEFSSLCHSYKLSRSWLLGTHPCSCQRLSGQARLVYLQFREGFPSPPLRHSVHPTLFAMCLYCSYCLLLSFSFFPGWGLVCPGGYADLAQGCLWKYHVLLSSPWPHLPSHLGTGNWWPGGPPGVSV
jgi:hypothetical protein